MYPVVFSHTSHLIVVIGTSESLQPIRIELATCRIQLLTVVFGQLCPKGVDGDDEGSTIGLELKSNLLQIVTKGFVSKMPIVLSKIYCINYIICHFRVNFGLVEKIGSLDKSAEIII